MARGGKFAPLHQRHKLLAAPLNPDLRKNYGRVSLPVRKGDRVRIMRGDFRGIEGEVTEVNMKKCRIAVEGAITTKADGSEVPRWIHPSNVMIVKLQLEDKERRKILERRSKGGKERSEQTS
ncbi:MAG: 50S ribosomal protein L24 [Hadesarchaea archaeon]|nr:50S ribosomal protein L24 [Hadesarchaea archaeon]